MALKNEVQARQEFATYFIDLRNSISSEGGKVNKYTEWEFFIKHMIDEGELPSEAINWKCPRSLN